MSAIWFALPSRYQQVVRDLALLVLALLALALGVALGIATLALALLSTFG